MLGWRSPLSSVQDLSPWNSAAHIQGGSSRVKEPNPDLVTLTVFTTTEGFPYNLGFRICDVGEGNASVSCLTLAVDSSSLVNLCRCRLDT